MRLDAQDLWEHVVMIKRKDLNGAEISQKKDYKSLSEY